MQKRCCRLAWTEEKKLVTDTNRPAKRWLGALSAAPRSGEISPKNYRNRPEYQSQHHCDENERPAPSACRARGAASGRWRRASNTDLLNFLDASVSFYLGHGSIADTSYGSDEAGAQATAQSGRTKPVLVANRFHAISQASMMSARLRNTELASQWLRR